MPVPLIAEANLPEEAYAEMAGKMTPLIQSAKGLICHAGGPDLAGKWRVVEIWESEEDGQNWFDHKHKPSLPLGVMPKHYRVVSPDGRYVVGTSAEHFTCRHRPADTDFEGVSRALSPSTARQATSEVPNLQYSLWSRTAQPLRPTVPTDTPAPPWRQYCRLSIQIHPRWLRRLERTSRIYRSKVLVQGDMIAFENTASGGSHSEQFARTLIIDGRKLGYELEVKRIYSELSPCAKRAPYCLRTLEDSFSVHRSYLILSVRLGHRLADSERRN